MKAKLAYSGYLLSFEPRRTDKIEENLHLHGEAVESFSTLDSEFERREVVFLSVTLEEPTIGIVALMERMYGSGGTGKLKMRISEPIFIDPAISAGELSTVVSLKEGMSTAVRMRRIDSVLWPKLVGAIKRLRPEIQDAFEQILVARTQEKRLFGEDDRLQRLIEERDAIGLALDVGGLDRPSILRSLSASGVDTAASVLDLLDSERLQEQDVIRHDQQVFMEMLDPASRVAQFEGPSGTVRVYVSDKKPLETVLGIDLLIYQSIYKSFLLVQYKTMQRTYDGNRPNWYFRIDQQILEQIAAMKTVEVAIDEDETSPEEITGWRLNTTPFYFKFCETTRPDARDESLIRGITLSLQHLKDFHECTQYQLASGCCPRIKDGGWCILNRVGGKKWEFVLIVSRMA